MTSITWGGKRAMLGNFIDITERKQAEERLEQAAQEMENNLRFYY